MLIESNGFHIIICQAAADRKREIPYIFPIIIACNPTCSTEIDKLTPEGNRGDKTILRVGYPIPLLIFRVRSPYWQILVLALADTEKQNGENGNSQEKIHQNPNLIQLVNAVFS